MFRVITGVPGSGKTFYAVNYLKKFVQYDKLYDTMIMNSDVLLVTNIENIKIKHVKFEDYRDAGLMTIEATRKYMKENNYKRLIMIIDEGQRYFSQKQSDEMYFFFEYHRHLGMDIFIIVQTVQALQRRITELAEYVIDALPKAYTLSGFRYEVKDSKTGMRFYSTSLSVDKEVFRLYQSFEADEMVKAKPVLFYKFGVAILVLLIAGFSFIYYVNSGMYLKKLKTTEKPAKVSQQIDDRHDNRQIKTSTKEKAATDEPESFSPAFAEIDGVHPIIPNPVVKGYVSTKDKTYILYK